MRFNRILCIVILGIWSWSLLQFAMVLTATRARKDQSGVFSKEPNTDSCCTPDVYGIVISIFMQDAPFLCLRLLLIFKYEVLSYTNFFFTCKNSLVIMLLIYRLIVVQIERRRSARDAAYMDLKESNSRIRLMNTSNSSERFHSLYKERPPRFAQNHHEPPPSPEKPVLVTWRRHLSLEDINSPV